MRRGVGRFLWRHHTALFLGAIVGIAALPRLWGITDVGLRGDEAVYAGQAAVLSGDDELDRYFVLASRGNSNFLFYQQVVAGVYLLFGVSDVAARLVAIAFSTATVLVCFELGRTLYSQARRPAGRRSSSRSAATASCSGGWRCSTRRSCSCSRCR